MSEEGEGLCWHLKVTPGGFRYRCYREPHADIQDPIPVSKNLLPLQPVSERHFYRREPGDARG